MSKSSIASTQSKPIASTQAASAVAPSSSSRPVSAWSKGPPIAARSSSASPAPNAAAAPSNARSPTPAGSAPASGSVTPTTAAAAHGKKASVAIKDGVSVGRGVSLGHKTGSSMSFGSIDASSPTAPTPATSPPPAQTAQTTATVPDVKTFGSLPAQKKDETGAKKDAPAAAAPAVAAPAKPASPTKESQDKKEGAAAPPVKKPLNKKIDVNSLFQSVPQNQPSSTPSPGAASTHPSLPSSSPAPPTPNNGVPIGTPSMRPSGPNGLSINGGPSNIYNSSLPIRAPPGGPGGPNMQVGMGMGMMRFPPSGPSRGGPPGGPNGMGRAQPQQQNGQPGPQGPPGSPRPPGPGPMMSPMGHMMAPPTPGAPWSPYHPGMPYPYYPGAEQMSPFPQYWHGPPGVPPQQMQPHPQGMPMPGQPSHMQMPPHQQHPGQHPHPGFMPPTQGGPPQQQQPGMPPVPQGMHPLPHHPHSGFVPPHPGLAQHPGGPQNPMSPPHRNGPMPPPQQQQQQQGGPVTPLPQTPMHPQGIPTPMQQQPHGPQHQGPPPPPQQQQGHLPLPTPMSAHPQTPVNGRPSNLQPSTPGTPAFSRYTLGPGGPPPSPGGSALSGAAREFVPSKRVSTLKITRPDGTPLDLSHVRSTSISGLPTPGLGGAPVAEEKVEKIEAVRKPSQPVRMESEQSKAKRQQEEREAKERAEREAKEAEERKVEEERKAKEEEERKEKERIEEEEKERVRKEEEEKERVRKEKEEEEAKIKAEADAKAKAEADAAEAKAKAEAEEKARVEAEAKAKAEAEAKVKAEAEEKARLEAEEKAKAEAEAEAARVKAEEEEKARVKAEADAKAKALQDEEERLRELEIKKAESAAAADLAVAAAEKASNVSDTLSALPVSTLSSAHASASHTPTSPSTPELPPVNPIPIPTLPASFSGATIRVGNGAPITPADLPKLRRPIPGPLDLASTTNQRISPALPTAQAAALLSARPIEDFSTIQYPAGIKTPNPDLNAGGPPGKFRYERDFLLQFMGICKDKPESLPPLDAIGLTPAEEGSGQSFGGGRAGPGAGGRRGPMTPTSRVTGLGISGPNPFGGKGGFQMGQFQAPARTSEDRLRQSDLARSVSAGFGGPGVGIGRPISMSRTASGTGLANAVPPSPSQGGRTRSQRGRQRPEPRQNPSQFGQQGGYNMQHGQGGFEPVAPLEHTATRWQPQAAMHRNERVTGDTPEVVERKVKALLNKLTVEKFDSISDQIVAWANRSEHETDGRTLIQVIRLVFEKATDEPTWSEMYARLCRKMMEKISPTVMDVQVKNNDGEPIIGGQLFRKYLLNRCQEDFERGWTRQRQAIDAAALMAGADESVPKKEGEEQIFSDEYYAAQKAKRRGLGLVKLIGELFKLSMLTERIMHECIKKMLANVDSPAEEEIESLCKLLNTVGSMLDTHKAKAHMDIYFSRMREMAGSPKINSRMRFMLQELIELRERGWHDRKGAAATTSAPMTIAQIHQAAEREAEQKAAQSRQGQAMSRGGSRRGDARGEYGPDGWTNVPGGPPPRPVPTKAGDLSHFGKINKTTGPIGGFGPSTAFKKEAKNRAEATQAPSRNMFNVLGSGGESMPEPEPAAAPAAKGPSRKPSVDLNVPAADAGGGRKKLKLLPRSIPVPKPEEESAPPSAIASPGEPEIPAMSDEKANEKISEDLKEFWAIRDVDEGLGYFKFLPSVHQPKLIDKLVGDAFNKKESDVVLVADVFSRAAAEGVVSAADFKKGLSSTVEYLDDVAVDVPQAYAFMAKLLKGAALSTADVEELAAKINVEGDPLVAPKDKLMREFTKLA